MNKRQRKKHTKKLEKIKLQPLTNDEFLACMFESGFNREELLKAYWDMEIFGNGIIQVFEDRTIKHIDIMKYEFKD